MSRPVLHIIGGCLAVILGVCGLGSGIPPLIFTGFMVGGLGLGWAGFNWAAGFLPDVGRFLYWLCVTIVFELCFLALANMPEVRDYTWMPAMKVVHTVLNRGPEFVLLASWVGLPLIVITLLVAILVSVNRRR